MGVPGSADWRNRVRVWDLPLRLFHWLLLLLVVVAFATGVIGGQAMVWHGRAGIGIAGLLTFRLVWGVSGSTHARFASFVRGPQAVRDYLAGRWEGLGHNPLGAFSVLAMLAVLAVQVASGLAANDDVAFEGPLYPLVAHEFSNALTELHETNAWIVGTLLVLHIAAIAFYARIKKQNLVLPMIRGWKERRNADEESFRGGGGIAFIVALLLALAAGWCASGKWIPAPPPPPPGQTAPDF